MSGRSFLRLTWCVALLLAVPSSGQAQPRHPMPTTTYDLFRAYNGGRPPGQHFAMSQGYLAGPMFPHYHSFPFVAPLPSALPRRIIPILELYYYPLYSSRPFLPTDLDLLPPALGPGRRAKEPWPLPEKEGPATLSFRVPSKAELFIDGGKSIQTGVFRSFTTPPIRPGQVASYEVRVRWTENGKPVERTRKIELHPNEARSFDFLTGKP